MIRLKFSSLLGTSCALQWTESPYSGFFDFLIMRRYLHLIFLLSLTWVCAGEAPNTSEGSSTTEGPSTTEAAIELALPAPARDEAPQVSVVAEDKSIVSVLGYHDFAHKQKATERNVMWIMERREGCGMELLQM